jgi:antibiotic biosynthesis monooxygenase (ABM) superfamily enzyme
MKSLPALALSLLVVVGVTSRGETQGQPSQPAEFIQVITTTVKSGAVADYEDFVKKIVAGANKIGAPQRWSTSQVSLGGPGFTYTVVLPFSKWAEVDGWNAVPDILVKAYGPAERARIMKSGRGAIERTETSVYRLLPDLSTRPKAFVPPPAFVHLFVTEVEPAMVPTWEKFLGQIKAAQEKSPQAPTAIRRVAVLGASNTYVTAVPFNKFAERDSWPRYPDVLRDAYGETEARSIDETRLRATRNARQLVLTYRPDLSRPAAAAGAATR